MQTLLKVHLSTTLQCMLPGPLDAQQRGQLADVVPVRFPGLAL